MSEPTVTVRVDDGSQARLALADIHQRRADSRRRTVKNLTRRAGALLDPRPRTTLLDCLAYTLITYAGFALAGVGVAALTAGSGVLLLSFQLASREPEAKAAPQPIQVPRRLRRQPGPHIEQGVITNETLLRDRA